MKTCIKCNQELDESNFYPKGGKNKDKGYQSKCKICFNINSKQYKEKNKKQINEYLNNYYLDNKEKIDNANKNNYKSSEAFRMPYSQIIDVNEDKVLGEFVVDVQSTVYSVDINPTFRNKNSLNTASTTINSIELKINGFLSFIR